jgi:hypothetical protein
MALKLSAFCLLLLVASTAARTTANGEAFKRDSSRSSPANPPYLKGDLRALAAQYSLWLCMVEAAFAACRANIFRQFAPPAAIIMQF